MTAEPKPSGVVIDVMELTCYFECPHCFTENAFDAVEFNLLEFSCVGGKSLVHKIHCEKCHKDFWVQASCELMIDRLQTWKKKPKASR